MWQWITTVTRRLGHICNKTRRSDQNHCKAPQMSPWPLHHAVFCLNRHTHMLTTPNAVIAGPNPNCADMYCMSFSQSPSLLSHQLKGERRVWMDIGNNTGAQAWTMGHQHRLSNQDTGRTLRLHRRTRHRWCKQHRVITAGHTQEDKRMKFKIKQELKMGAEDMAHSVGY